MPEFEWVQKWRTVSVTPSERVVQVKNWLGPNYPSFFRDKVVLDAGCGNGANAYIALSCGASKLIALDHNTSVLAAAKGTLNKFGDKVIYVEKDLDKANLDFKCDVVMCIGVLHHLQKPEEVLRKLLGCLNRGGLLLVWVYGKYSSPLLLRIVFFIRFFTARLPFVVNRVIAYPLAVALTVVSRVLSWQYLKQLRKFSFPHIYEIVLDQIFPKIARYYSEKEVKELIGDLPLTYYKDANDAGWLITGKRQRESIFK